MPRYGDVMIEQREVETLHVSFRKLSCGCSEAGIRRNRFVGAFAAYANHRGPICHFPQRPGAQQPTQVWQRVFVANLHQIWLLLAQDPAKRRARQKVARGIQHAILRTKRSSGSANMIYTCKLSATLIPRF